MLTAIFLICSVLFVVAFFTYGRFLERRLGIDNSRPTPSHTDYDGVDRVPAHPAVLFGHHFSSIAGAGPIVGPIIAAVAFGWVDAAGRFYFSRGPGTGVRWETTSTKSWRWPAFPKAVASR